jgi:hypothetical protein
MSDKIVKSVLVKIDKIFDGIFAKVAQTKKY